MPDHPKRPEVDPLNACDIDPSPAAQRGLCKHSI
jgi:hypothetical protein